MNTSPRPGRSAASIRRPGTWRSTTVGLDTPVVLGYDPQSDKWTTYRIKSPARRVAVDSKGRVWACEYFGNRIAMIDPASGAVTEYDLPLKWGNPYDLWPDAEGNIWVENAVYNSLAKFDPRTTKWTYVPFPELDAHTPKLDRDREGPALVHAGRQPRRAWRHSGRRATSRRARHRQRADSGEDGRYARPGPRRPSGGPARHGGVSSP